jgi:hypothetical protein
MSGDRFLGVCILVASIILGGSIAFHATATAPADQTEPQVGRYQFQPSNPPGVIWVIDTTTGKVTSGSG